jgi:biopolymer transport protein ExbB
MCWKIIIVLLLNYVAVFGNLTEEIKKAEKILNDERKKLIEIRQNIDKEKLPLAKEIMNINSSLREKRETFRYQKNILMSSDSSFSDVEKQLEMVTKEKDYINSLVSEFYYSIPKVRTFAETLEKEIYMQNIFENFINSDRSKSQQVVSQLLTEVFNHNKEKIGGREFEGKSINQQGDVIEGVFINYGSLNFFADENNILWNSISDINRLLPVSIKETGINKEKLQPDNLVMLPVDVTNGEAYRLSKLEKGFSHELKKGGYILYPIIALGFLCIITIIYKIISLWNINLDVEDKIEEVLQNISECKTEQAFKIAESMGKPLAPVIYEGIHHMNASKEDIEEIMHERILFQIPYLQKNLTLLAVTAAASPLLGLLGTVTGMIHTFNLVTVFGSGQANLLSGGISEALITTKYGLVVAIPALLSHAYFSRKVRKIISRLEQLSIAFINGLKIKETCKR